MAAQEEEEIELLPAAAMKLGSLSKPQPSPRRKQLVKEAPATDQTQPPPSPRVGTAKYFRSIMKVNEDILDPSHQKSSPRNHDTFLNPYKTEMWRERGAPRWPDHAKEHARRAPFQFARAEEVVPLQRNLTNSQGCITGELWCRSLRMNHLGINHIAKNNTNLTMSSLATTFDRRGNGWTGSTNTKQGLPERPTSKEWITRPVAVGKMSLEHMGGSRYVMDAAPRDCCPAMRPNSGAMTAR
mmetsp:Transcript_43144/g.91988  ORF Transcript_43144/g.91988 Transcript_43144/m.91988 type:complete len:241 (+) Transcript_43144:96-818(+)